MSNQEKRQDELLNSDYDGIQEYDNDLPRWWVQLFYITIGFALAYTIYFHFIGRPTPQEELKSEMQDLDALRQSYASSQQNANTVPALTIAELVKDKSYIDQGRAVFVSKCAACHGQQGEGIVGPNLTDEFWIHGGSPDQIRKVIVEGVIEKGMLAWKDVLSPRELDSVVAYVWSIYGSNPPNAKAPQGEKALHSEG